MPHSLYLGSGIVQARLYDYDAKNCHVPPTSRSEDKPPYVPSLPAIRFCLNYSIAELAISLFTFALFVNSAILIVSGASLHGNGSAANADLFGIYNPLSSSIAPAAGTIFALALLLSGISAGIVCTIAGQIVSEGALNWTVAPWLRRLITRSISITPSIIAASAVGREGLTAALNGTQVALSIVLPFVSAPLIYFTARNKYMTVRTMRDGQLEGLDDWEDDGNGNENGNEEGERDDGETRDLEVEATAGVQEVKMRNHWVTTVFAVAIWLVIAVMNVANLVLLKNES